MSSYIQKDGSLEPTVSQDVMVASEGGLATIADDFPIGTVAYTAGFKQMWQLDIDGSWVEIGGEAE